jgi:hypothetical protein
VPQRNDPKPPYESPSIEEIDTGGEPISTSPGDAGSPDLDGAES